MATSAMTIGEKLIAYCKANDELKGLEELYAENATSVEPDGRTATSVNEIRGKHQWWNENFEVHSANIEGPFPNGDRFSLIFEIDTTNKQTKERSKMKEVGLYTVAAGKIVKEEFFYPTS